jgi:hypothetical protein
LYLLHLAAFTATLFSYSWSETIDAMTKMTDFPSGYGFSLLIVYLIWIVTILILYPLCKLYNNFKSTHQSWWLSYI